MFNDDISINLTVSVRSIKIQKKLNKFETEGAKKVR